MNESNGMKKYSTLAFISILSAGLAQAAPVVTFEWDDYPVDATHNTGANKFILETKLDAGAYVAAPSIAITATTVAVDLAGRAGNTVTGRIKACRPGSYANPPTTADQCSEWSNESSKTISAPPSAPVGLKIQ